MSNQHRGQVDDDEDDICDGQVSYKEDGNLVHLEGAVFKGGVDDEGVANESDCVADG